MFKMNYNKQKIAIIIGFLALPLAFLFTFTFYPAAALLYFSFTEWDGLGYDMKWIGLANYKEIFVRPELFGVFKNNLFYFIGGLVQLALALYFAVLLNSKIRARNFFRALIFLPYVLHSVATAIMFKNIYHAEYGVLNVLLGSLGMESWQQQWLADTRFNNVALAFVSMWKYMGLNCIIFIGALQSISEDMYEAAKIDGANKWQSFRFITLPSIRKVMELMMVLTLTGALEVFDIPKIMTNGVNETTTFVLQTIDTAYAYQKFGLASAMSVVLLLIVAAVILIQRKFLFKGDE
ncbi:carbohydrate ABC transporter permease [Paenibacillus sp. NEAU-GSW1]|uniref:carbohydrate ABC transporter permease n=1 Tax=Paenibacillus sp. NEAU-GSW1 TaxID=2682486 RepID=UPI0012E2496D|nr:sugar ABC transporter permease [Paenibacillus sp. NEAU-GSW1]MUT65165.1 ABC transporter permease subunit [Paenibacillus sp. NEAU-GSW1]